MYNEEADCNTRESTSTGSKGSKNKRAEKKIYYYSKFDLFEQRQENAAFGKYRVFLDRLVLQLGEDWRIQTNQIFRNTELGSKHMFQYSLQIWLEINKLKAAKEIKQQDPNLNYQALYFQMFFQKVLIKLTSVNKIAIDRIDTASLKQLGMGFFVSANQIWEELASKKQLQPQPKGVFHKISGVLQSQSQSLFSPLMVVKEKMFALFNKKVKTEQIISPAEMKNFTKFKENLQEDEIQHKFKKLTLQQDQFQQQQTDSKKRGRSQTTSEVVFQKIPQQNPINYTLLQAAYKYIKNLITKKDKWQVARGFVTNIMEINYNKLQQKFTPTKKENVSEEEINVRVLKPAGEFYHNLMVVWLLFKNESVYQMKFKQYLQKVKGSFGSNWKENYVLPTKIFFSNLGQQWNKLALENSTKRKGQQEVIQIFVERVRENMEKSWQQNIVKKQGDFSQQITP